MGCRCINGGASELVQDLVYKAVSMEDCEEQCRLITLREINIVLQSMDVSKAPGLDGFSGIFTNIIGRLSRLMGVAVVQHFFSARIFLSNGKRCL